MTSYQVKIILYIISDTVASSTAWNMHCIKEGLCHVGLIVVGAILQICHNSLFDNLS